MIYACLQALLLMFLVSYTFDKDLNPYGQTSSFWLVGMVIYCIIVISVNYEVLYQTHNINFWPIFFFCFSTGSFFLVYGIEDNLTFIPSLYGTFYYLWITPQFYLLIIFMLITQIGAQILQRELVAWVFRIIDGKKKSERKRLGLPENVDENVESHLGSKRNSVAPALLPKSHSGFAFSGEAGHDIEVIRRLPSIDQIRRTMTIRPRISSMVPQKGLAMNSNGQFS